MTHKKESLEHKEVFLRSKYSYWLSVVVIFSLFSYTYYVTAWQSDDAYISFRTVDNFLNGYGLRWNVGERAQAYTHPLWLFLIIPMTLLTGDVYPSSMLLSFICSGLVYWTLLSQAHTNVLSRVSVIALLLCSHSFVEYSSSGLENPLSHILVITFAVIFLKQSSSDLSFRQLLSLSLLAGLATFNRIDTILFFVPPLASLLLHRKWLNRILPLCLGFLPLILWEAFSLLYYGFLIPNTAYAKLSLSVPPAVLYRQGYFYYENLLLRDPLTFCTIVLGMTSVFLFRPTKSKCFILSGLILYLLYIVKIGGDFMEGRFFSIPLLISSLLLLSSDRKVLLSITAVLLIALQSLFSPKLLPALRQDVSPQSPKHFLGNHGIAHEQGYYQPHTSLRRYLNGEKVPDHIWADEGRELKNNDQRTVIVHGAIGFLGYHAGPKVHIIDENGLSDPLIARITTLTRFRPGHYKRAIPKGYVETIKKNKLLITDKKIRQKYKRLKLVTQNDLFEKERLQLIRKYHMRKAKQLLRKIFLGKKKL